MRWWLKSFHLTLSGLLLALGAAHAAWAGPEGAGSYKGYATPPYQIERTDGAQEIRRYPGHLVAEVTVEGSRKGAIGRGFRLLAGYIFGDNDGGEKIAMTSPVAQLPQSDSQSATGAEGWRVQFMMPPEVDRASLPAPERAAIRLIETGPERLLVRRFSGRWSAAALAREEASLRAYAEAQGLRIRGAPRYFFYDAPFTLPGQRRNEIALPLG